MIFKNFFLQDRVLRKIPSRKAKQTKPTVCSLQIMNMFVALRITAKLLSAHRFSKHTRAQYMTWLLTHSDKTSERGCVSVLLRSLLLCLSFLQLNSALFFVLQTCFSWVFPWSWWMGFHPGQPSEPPTAGTCCKGHAEAWASVLWSQDKGARTDAH